MDISEMSHATETCTVEAVGKKRVRYKCGHTGPVKAVFNLYGQRYGCNPEQLKGREKCPTCLNEEGLKSLIRCCRCGFSIMPGSGIVRYADIGSYRKEWTTVSRGGAVGCMRTGCCDNPHAVSGTWDGQKIEDAFGGMVIGGQSGGFGGFGGD